MYDIKEKDKLPQNVQDMPEKEQAAWVATWNNVYQECKKDGGEDCEGKAFAIANGNVKKAEMANRTLSEANRQALQTAHKTIGDILDNQDKKETPPSDAPGYRLAMANGDNCASCANMQDGQCQAYDMATSKKYVCDSHEVMTAEMTSVLVSDLAGQVGKPFVGLVFGQEFTDMYGRLISFPAKDKQTYLSNTLSAIEATRTESGELVGLPIDEGGHSKGKSAGRIVGAELGTLKRDGKTYDVLRFIANWTKIGIELISENIVRGFSPTVNPAGRVVLGGSLTNWPASTDKSGVPLMPPLELSQQAEENDMGMTDQDLEKIGAMLTTAMTGIEAKFDEKLAALKPQIEAGAELSQDGQKLDPKAVELEINRQRKEREAVELVARRKVELEYHEREKANRIMELSTQLVTGTERTPYGLPIVRTELQEMLHALPAEELPKWQNLLTTVQQKGLIDYSQHGHGQTLQGTKQLPAELAEQLQSAIKAGHTIDKWFSLAGIGDKKEYNLSQFEGGK